MNLDRLSRTKFEYCELRILVYVFVVRVTCSWACKIYVLHRDTRAHAMHQQSWWSSRNWFASQEPTPRESFCCLKPVSIYKTADRCGTCENWYYHKFWGFIRLPFVGRCLIFPFNNSQISCTCTFSAYFHFTCSSSYESSSGRPSPLRASDCDTSDLVLMSRTYQWPNYYHVMDDY